MGFSLGKIVGGIADTIFPGTGQLVKGLTGGSSGIGGLMNDITGQTSAGKMNQKYAKELAAINQKYALESGAKNQEYALESAAKSQEYARANMALQNQYEVTAAKNAHQWEIQDLKRAGLNPILSAGGQGAQADAGLINASVGSGSGGSGSAGAGSQGAAGMDIFNSAATVGRNFNEMLQTAANTKRTKETTGPEVERIKSETDKNTAEAAAATQNQIESQARTDKIRLEAGSEALRQNELRLNSELAQRDFDTLYKFGITRREMIQLGGKALDTAIDLVKANKYSKAADFVKETLKGKRGNKI